MITQIDFYIACIILDNISIIYKPLYVLCKNIKDDLKHINSNIVAPHVIDKYYKEITDLGDLVFECYVPSSKLEYLENGFVIREVLKVMYGKLDIIKKVYVFRN